MYLLFQYLQEKKNYMNKLKLVWCSLLIIWALNCSAQKSNKFIQVQLNDYQSFVIKNYGRMAFKMGTTEAIKSKIFIVNDSQFLLLNSFNELSEDTLNIKDVSAVKVKLGGQLSDIDPALAAVAIVFLWPIAVPVLIYKLIANDTKKWVKREGFSIAIYNNQ